MIMFLNNGGIELILAAGYFTYIMLLAKLEDRRVMREQRKTEKWHW